MPSPLGLVNSNNYRYSLEDGSYNSIFNKNKFYYRPITKNDGSSKSVDIHGAGSSSGKNDIYNITTSSIIDYTANTSMELRDQDFAYLRNYGVFPNNRLIVARRFQSPVEDDLTSVDQKPISTLVSWFEGEKSPLKISFGEKWENGQGNLVELLDSMLGNENKMLGGGVKSLDSFFRGGVPFSGFSEGLQYELLKGLGLTDKGLENVPSGNPNLIQESKKRGLVGDSGGSAMTTRIDINFETTYEQKFIGGNDPTLVYLDIINNILRFGGSESNFYINGKGGDLMRDFLNKFRKGQWIQAMSVIVGSIIDLMSNIVQKLFTAIKEITSAVASISQEGGDPISSIVTDAFSAIGSSVISKYRVQIGGIISSLTGESSTPWHVTIGNPKSPIFSTGDMYTQNVTIELGEVLAFNDLPSKITVSCTLTNARSMGIQEIFAKFNSGKGRSYVNLDKSVLETGVSAEEKKEIDKILSQENPKVSEASKNINDQTADSISEAKRKEKEVSEENEEVKTTSDVSGSTSDIEFAGSSFPVDD